MEGDARDRKGEKRNGLGERMLLGDFWSVSRSRHFIVQRSTDGLVRRCGLTGRLLDVSEVVHEYD